MGNGYPIWTEMTVTNLENLKFVTNIRPLERCLWNRGRHELNSCRGKGEEELIYKRLYFHA